MTIPDAWLIEHCSDRFPLKFGFCEAESERVQLTISRSVLIRSNVSEDELQADLKAGMTVESRSDGNSFIICGSQFRLIVRPSNGPVSNVPTAVVVSINPVMVPRRRYLVQPLSVSIEPFDREAKCDLPRLAEIFINAKSVRRKRENLVKQARRQLPPADRRAPQGNRKLAAIVNRNAGHLLALLEALKLRVTTAPEQHVTGTVVSCIEGTLTLTTASSSSAIDTRSKQTIATHDGRLIHCRVDEVGSDSANGRISLIVPAELSIPPGTQLQLSQIQRFALQPNLTAVRSFLSGNVDGNWNHLAGLLCQPGGLPPFDPPSLPYFHLEDSDLQPGFQFSEEQKRAIAGAVHTPHTLLIQGPPGTGKTSVIAETVLQLIDRGERILLLAPMHVALDEVLLRLSQEPSVFPIRVSWTETKVRNDLQRYLPDQVAATYLRQARTPDKSNAKIWRQELAVIEPVRQAVASYLDLKKQYLDYDQTIRTGSAELQESQRRYDEAIKVMSDSEAIDVKQAVQLHEQIRASKQRLEHLKLEQPKISGPGRIAWAQATGELKQRIRTSERRLAQLRQRVAAISQRTTAREQEMFDRALDQASLRERFARELIDAEQNIGTARDRLAEARDHLSQLTGLDAETVEDEHWVSREQELTAQIDTVTKFIKLELRWFELTGQADGRPEHEISELFGAQLRQSANVVCATTGGAASLDDVDFDTLILDEASRVTDSEFLIGAVRARRWILVGDEQQLPPFVEPTDEHHLHALAASRLVDRKRAKDLAAATDLLAVQWHEELELRAFRRDAVVAAAEALRATDQWPTHRRSFEKLASRLGRRTQERAVLKLMRKHVVQSLFERCLPTTSRGLVVRLTAQRRMIEPIASLVNQPIYNGAFTTPPPQETQPSVRSFALPAFRTPVVFMDTAARGRDACDQHDGSGFINELEADWVCRVCRNLEDVLQEQDQSMSVSVLTFYKKQAQLIRQRLGHPHLGDFSRVQFKVIGVIDSIQGQQSDIVILSFCRASIRPRLSPDYGRWLQDVRRVNVALTRARRGMVMVGHRPTLERLTAVPKAGRLYQHIFEMLETRKDVMSIIKDAG
ncbi:MULTISPECIES: DEAD/DEAH box helicase [unclassified Micromonospora]|uniref:DEAD/DEAH box helicase n=1 Tax=unclassified Micromonospora TaxID=2617518 RepID=UPI0015E7FF17|nr:MULTISPECIES: AAA domain-containing protein [unclassified Micromonospora]MCK1804958.1 AAA domain-containing protein [Micromonospora sp. R42106]MCK1834154.1 AAA domain-containing protein [Micromonospora sp. R42003]MCK1845421.1 AAA domain-containing protein [Micromonospora sp. R42004]MCM1018875.1 AAA domain-containing protein [Micromonospora sp. XM-20-01]